MFTTCGGTYLERLFVFLSFVTGRAIAKSKMHLARDLPAVVLLVAFIALNLPGISYFTHL